MGVLGQAVAGVEAVTGVASGCTRAFQIPIYTETGGLQPLADAFLPVTLYGTPMHLKSQSPSTHAMHF